MVRYVKRLLFAGVVLIPTFTGLAGWAQSADAPQTGAPHWVRMLQSSPGAEKALQGQERHLEDLAARLQHGADDDRLEAAEELAKLMKSLAEAGHKQASQHVALALFHAPAAAGRHLEFASIQRRAFGLLAADSPHLLRRDTTTVVLQAPNIACHGRFLESLQEHVRDQQAWIMQVELALLPEPYRQAPNDRHVQVLNENGPIPATTLGRDTEIRFVVRSGHSAEELVRVLHQTGRYAMDDWTVTLQAPVSSLLK